MTRYAMAIDIQRCTGCQNCIVACKTENNVPDGYHRSWIAERVYGAYPSVRIEMLSQRCNHCEIPPCVACCPTGASHIHARDGIVVIDRAKCIGCKICLTACPYGARYIHPDGYGDKCTFCLPRIEKGLDPACVSVCSTHCMHFGDLDDPESEVSRLLLTRSSHVLLPEAGTKPHVHYLR